MSQGVKPSGQGLQRLLKALGTRAFREKKKREQQTLLEVQQRLAIIILEPIN